MSSNSYRTMEESFSPSSAPTPIPGFVRETTIALQTIQLTTSTFSCVASSTIFFMIWRSENGLRSPYRRIIFALSCADILSSLGFMTGPILVPHDEEGVYWTVGGPSGTIATCELNGFILTLGGTAAPMYMCGLCIYYLCKVNYSMSDRAFAQKIEKPIHALIVGWSLAGAIVALITDNLNSVPGGDTCFISSSPVKCEVNPLVDCKRGEHSATYAMVISYIPNVFSFLGIAVCMTRIACKVHYMGRMSSIYRRRRPPSNTTSLNSSENSEVAQGCTGRFFKVIASTITRLVNSSASTEEVYSNNEIVSRREANARARMRETYQQAILYVLTFFLVYIWPYIYGVNQLIGTTKMPFVFAILFYIFYPLGGAFNILVYTRLKVAAVRRRDPELYWIQCFWEVIKAGGDAPPRPPRQPIAARLRRRGAGSSSQQHRHAIRRRNNDNRSRSSRATVRRGTRRVDRIDSNAIHRSQHRSVEVEANSVIPTLSNSLENSKNKSSGLGTCSSDTFSANQKHLESSDQYPSELSQGNEHVVDDKMYYNESSTSLHQNTLDVMNTEAFLKDSEMLNDLSQELELGSNFHINENVHVMSCTDQGRIMNEDASIGSSAIEEGIGHELFDESVTANSSRARL